MNNYTWNKKNIDLLPDEIAPWKLPRDKHATISVLTHALQELHTVDDYLSKCEQQFGVEYVKPMHGTTEQAWEAAKVKLNAQFNKRRAMLLWSIYNSAATKSSGTVSQTSIKLKVTFKKCYSFAVDKIGYLGTNENIICAVIITEQNRRNLFVYYLPVTPKWQAKIMSKDKNEYGTLLHLTYENGERRLCEVFIFLFCRVFSFVAGA